MKIRSLAVLGDPGSWSQSALRDKMGEWASIIEAAARAVSRRGLEVWSRRIVLSGPPREPGIVERVVSAAPEGFFVGLGHSEDPGLLLEAARRGLYAYGLMRAPGQALRYAEVMMEAARSNPEDATRIAVSVSGRTVSTPYLPIASAPRGSARLAASLLYPRDLLEAAGRGLEELEAGVRKVFSAAEEALPNTAIDYSLSPWMEESVAELVEKLCGCRFGDPGSAHSVSALARAIRRSAGDNAIGFNEVMLPLEEDSRLKELASAGRIRARDLLLLSSVCLAGLDMAVVNASKRQVASLLLDARSLALSTGKPLGVRVIPVDSPPGSRVDLGRFGEATVIPP